MSREYMSAEAGHRLIDVMVMKGDLQYCDGLVAITRKGMARGQEVIDSLGDELVMLVMLLTIEIMAKTKRERLN